MKKLLTRKRSSKNLLKFDLKMKLSTLFIFVTLFSINANTSYSQSTKISLDFNNITVGQLIDEIENQSDFRFVYKIKDVDLNRIVNIKVKKKLVTSILDEMFLNTMTTYNILDKQIFLLNKNDLDSETDKSNNSINNKQQQNTVSGTVTNNESMPLPGASITVKGTNKGVAADFDGKYNIKANVGDILIFSFVGFISQEITVVDSMIIDVTMEEDAGELDEVLVVAYGKQKKDAITGSVGVIKSNDIQNVKDANVLQGLAGKVSGVRIAATSGQPGEAPEIRIRGLNSLNALNSPLYVIDGIPLELDVLTIPGDTGDTGIRSSHLAAINPNDIESISILKDAVAASLYGSRAANGVVVITTKKGSSGKPKVMLDVSTNIRSIAVKNQNISDPGKYYEAYFQILKNRFIGDDGLTPEEAAIKAADELIVGSSESLLYNSFNVPNDQLIDPVTGKLNPNASLLWNDKFGDQIFQTPVSTKTFVSVSGGNENSKYYFSLGHDKDESYVLTSDYERTSLRLSLDQDITDKFKVGAKINYTLSTKNMVNLGGSAGRNPLAFTNRIAPIYPIFGYELDGTPVLDGFGNQVLDYGIGDAGLYPLPSARPRLSELNPLGSLREDEREQRYDDIGTLITTSYNFTKNFSFTYNFSINSSNSTTSLFRHAVPFSIEYLDSNPNDTDGIARKTESFFRIFSATHQQLFSWNKTFGKHSLDVLLGHESNKQNFKEFSARKQNILIPESNALSNAIDVNNVVRDIRGFGWDYTVEGYLFRANYDYDSKYFLNTSYRRDASSVFHPDVRWGGFYGIGGAWKMSKEKFLSDVDWLDNLRLKVSFGQQGNDRIVYPTDTGINDRLTKRRNYLTYEDQFVVTDDDGDGQAEISHAYNGNEDLTWETSSNFNIGFDIALFKNRLSIETEYFTQEISDLLYNDKSLLSLGQPSFPRNVGDMINRGVEVTVNAGIIETENFSWDFSINATHVKNEVTHLPPISDTNLIYENFFKLEVGRSAFEYFLPEFAGVDEETGRGLYNQYNEDRTEVIDLVSSSNATPVFIGKTAEPDLFGGFSTHFKYKSFSLTTNFTYQIGGYGLDSKFFSGLAVSEGEAISKGAFNNTWTSDNTSAPWQKAGDPFNNSSQLLTKTTYLSFESVRIDYEIPNNVASKLGVNAINLYASANNLHLWSEREGFDPRLSFTGRNETGSFGLSRTVSFGINIKF